MTPASRRSSASARSIEIARKGVRNLLIHSRILIGELELGASVALDMQDDNCFVFARDDGLFETRFDLGESVEMGDIIARIWPLDRTGVAPINYCAARGGLLVSRHFPGLVKAGDCLAVIATELGKVDAIDKA